MFLDNLIPVKNTPESQIKKNFTICLEGLLTLKEIEWNKISLELKNFV